MFEILLVIVGFLAGWVSLSWAITRCDRLEQPERHDIRIKLAVDGRPVIDMGCLQLDAFLRRCNSPCATLWTGHDLPTGGYVSLVACRGQAGTGQFSNLPDREGFSRN